MINLIFSGDGKVLVDFLSQKQHQNLSGVSIQYKQEGRKEESYVKVYDQGIYDLLTENFEFRAESEMQEFHRSVVQDLGGWITASR